MHVYRPRHDGLRHPLEVHVAGEDGEVEGVDRGRCGGRLPVGEQYVNQELKTGAPRLSRFKKYLTLFW